MDWIDEYDLFLFDLDGLLVDTEGLHYLAYVRMCEERGFRLKWGLSQYLQIAGLDADAPRRYIYQEFPELEKQEPDWKILYAEKKKAFLDIVSSEPAPLLEGVEKLLLLLEKKNKKRCVVTHSQQELVELLRKQNPILNSIPHWFTRETYKNPKPAADGYEKAIFTMSRDEDRIIGFEDSPRGMEALLQTKAKAVLINGVDAEVRKKFSETGVLALSSFEELQYFKKL